MVPNPLEFAGLNIFLWFFAVVEDTADPLYLGRVRVRCFGWHTPDKTAVPTSALPWASVIVPATSASTSGIGTSPTGLVTGSWVFGFFADGEKAQQPIVLGSIQGIPQQLADATKGFNDPTGTYPSAADTADVSALARTDIEANTTPLMQYKWTNLTKAVPTAQRYPVSSVAQDKSADAYAPAPWDEPLPRGGQPSLYPHNQVKTTPAGHAIERDSTPGNVRLHTFHPAGTYEEIQNDGSRVVKVVGSDYEIIAGGKNVLIKGACNITVAGDCRLRVDGDLVEEIGGDYHLTVRGNRLTKIIGNDAKEVTGSEATQVNTNAFHRCTGDRDTTTGGVETVLIGGDRTSTISGDEIVQVSGKLMLIGGDEAAVFATTACNIGAGSTCQISGGTGLLLAGLTQITGQGTQPIAMTAPADLSITATGTITITGATVTVNP